MGESFVAKDIKKGKSVALPAEKAVRYEPVKNENSKLVLMKTAGKEEATFRKDQKPEVEINQTASNIPIRRSPRNHHVDYRSYY